MSCDLFIIVFQITNKLFYHRFLIFFYILVRQIFFDVFLIFLVVRFFYSCVRAVAYLRWVFLEGAEHELIEKQRLSTIKSLQKLDNPAVTQDFLATKPDNSLQPVLKQIINNAKQELIISSFGWEINHGL